MTNDIYKDHIVTLAKAKNGDGRLENPDASIVLDNPLCGDRITLDIKVAEGRISAVGHYVRGCMLCEASASLIGAKGVGSAAADVQSALDQLRVLLKDGTDPQKDGPWSDLDAFAPVGDFKSRHECVLLPFEALVKAMDDAEN